MNRDEEASLTELRRLKFRWKEFSEIRALNFGGEVVGGGRR